MLRHPAGMDGRRRSAVHGVGGRDGDEGAKMAPSPSGGISAQQDKCGVRTKVET